MQRDPGAGPGQFDAAQIQQRLLETVVGRFQRELESTDEEWMVIHPLLGKVLNLEFAGLRELIGRMGGRGGIPLLSGGQPEVNALRDALAKPETSTEELEAKMKAVRDARKKNEEALRKAREDLRKVLTMRQEAKLVLAGILD
jgi:hypothetical protein